MKKETMKKAGALVGTMVLAGNAAPVVMAEQPAAEVPAVQVGAAEDNDVTILEREAESYNKVANVAVDFAFDQDTVTPTDEVFNLFGTVTTSICATPSFALDQVDHEDIYINFGGSIMKAGTVSIEELKAEGTEERTLKCSCGTGSAIANAQVVGVPLRNVMQLVDLEEGTNTVTFTGGDGYSVAVPLSYALEKDAILVYKVGGVDQPNGAQIWMPKSVARYFARNVVDVEFSKEETEPEIITPYASQRAKISILNRFTDSTFAVGDQIRFEGYADDFDKTISAVEFSMDGGETWTVCATEGTDADRWVYWTAAYVTEAAGTYKLEVRARTEDGNVSPMAASIVFNVK